MTPEEQEIYDRELKRKWDNEAVKEQQRLDFEEEKERSRIEAKIEEKKQTALEMKKEGYTIDQIVKITKLSVEEINAL